MIDDTDEDINAARAFVLKLYPKQKRLCKTLDELRFIVASNSDKPASQLPPTEDSFSQHVARARYQVAVWRNSHVPCPELWDPNGSGWEMSAGILKPIMFSKDVAPKEVRNLTHLFCTDHGCGDRLRCQCIKMNLKCTDQCRCRGTECLNEHDDSVHSDNDDDLDN